MYDLSIDQLKVMASEGDAPAQIFLGVMYSKGESVPQDHAKALYWFEQAAAQNEPLAMFNIGVLHEHGHGLPIDLGKALWWYAQSAERGCLSAQHELAWRYENGDGVAKNVPLAVYWHVKAADSGDRWSQTRLWSMSKTGAVPVDNERARYWAQRVGEERDNAPAFKMKYIPSEVSLTSGTRAYDPSSGLPNVPVISIDSDR